MDEQGPLTPDEAFRLLGEASRLEILRTVWEAEEQISFSEIRTRMGNPDSGRFNYHIDKLRDHFLTSTEDGYQLTQAGREVVRAILAGTVSERPTMDGASIGTECTECGGELVARYDGHGVVECGECGTTVMWNEFPPAGLSDREGASFTMAFDRWTQSRFRLAMDGICPTCAAAMTTEVLDHDSDAPASLHRCSNCKYEARVPLFGHVFRHPAVVAEYYDAGVDITGLPYWELQSLAVDIEETVSATDPWRATVRLDIDGRELVLTLDESVSVVDVDRSDR